MTRVSVRLGLLAASASLGLVALSLARDARA